MCPFPVAGGLTNARIRTHIVAGQVSFLEVPLPHDQIKLVAFSSLTPEIRILIQVGMIL